MRSLVRRATPVLIAAGVMAACMRGAGEGARDSAGGRATDRATDGANTGSHLPADVTRAREAWRAAPPAHYAYRWRLMALRPGAGVWYRIEVRDGRVASVIPAEPGAIPKGRLLTAAEAPTIDGLFAFAERGVAERADSVEVRLDPTGRWPTRVMLDWRRDARDDEQLHEADSLVVLP